MFPFTEKFHAHSSVCLAQYFPMLKIGVEGSFFIHLLVLTLPCQAELTLLTQEPQDAGSPGTA